jgi:EmrB/QacA subfamily drug resistance transporter
MLGFYAHALGLATLLGSSDVRNSLDGLQASRRAFLEHDAAIGAALGAAGVFERSASGKDGATSVPRSAPAVERNLLLERFDPLGGEDGMSRSEVASAGGRWVLPATILGSSLSFIDGSVVNVALPAMRQSFDTSLATMQWVVNGYMLALASLILLGGSAGDRYGRRRVFVAGLLGFTAASLASALAPRAPWLIAARFAQGTAAALLTPASLAIIGAAYGGKARGPAVGTWAAAGALTSALGPPLGGWLVDTVGWRAIFLINLPLGIAALALAMKLPADRGIADAPPLDRRGSALAVLALGSVCYGLIALGEGRVPRGVIALVAGLPLLLLFIHAESRADAPMMPLSLFANRDFSGANALTLLLYAALGGALFMLPFQLIESYGYSALAAGAALLPFAVVMGLGSRWSGGLVETLGSRTPLVVGPVLTAAGFVVLALSGGNSSYWIGVLPGLLVASVGMTIAVAPLTTTVLDAAPASSSGTASGINNAAARAGSLLAVAAVGLGIGDASSIDAMALSGAYGLAMYAAGGLAALSAAIAALTLAPRGPSQARG